MANDAAAVSGASDAINNAIQTGATNLGQAQTDLGQNALPKASSALDSFAAVSGEWPARPRAPLGRGEVPGALLGYRRDNEAGRIRISPACAPH